MRVVASMDDMFENSKPDAALSLCGFYWVTSGTAILEFGIDGVGDTCQIVPGGSGDETCQIIEEADGLIPDISIDADGLICHCPAVSEGGKEGGVGP